MKFPLPVFLLLFAAFVPPSFGTQAVTLPNVQITADEVLNLWPATPPDETEAGRLGGEQILADRPRPFDQITHVTSPTLSVFLPEPEKHNGTAMLVIPGGGLERLAIEHEGYEVAEWLNDHGIAAFLLKYRVPPRDPAKRWKSGLQDAQRAMSLIRSRAAEWKIDTDSIGAIGFSAGAEIDVLLSTYQRDGDRQYPRIDAADDLSTRPAFNIAIYGGGFADVRANALREDIATRIDRHTPPMFILHAFDDGALSSVILMNALKRAGVASELHIFGAGAHGFGVRETGLPVGEWRSLCLNWLRWHGYLDSAPLRTYATDFFRAYDERAKPLPRFTASEPELTLDDAFAAQRRVVRLELARGAEVAGYKGAFASAAAQSAAGLRTPLHGVLFKAGRIESSERNVIRLDPRRPLLVETEIGFIIATDIGTKLRTSRQALTTIESIVPVIELPADFAANMEGSVSPRDLVAGNAGSDRYLVGAAVSPQSLGNIDALPLTLSRDGTLMHETTGGIVGGGTAHHLMTLINQIVEQGRILHRGDLIITGALPRAHPAAPGNYAADFGALGKIEFVLE